MNYVIYDSDTGEIVRRMQSPPSEVSIQCRDGEEFYLGCPPDATHIIDNEPVTIVPEVVPPTLADAKESKLKELAADRYREETGGITVGSAIISTDRDSQAMMTGALLSLKSGLVASVNWKGENEWVSLTLAELEPIAQAVSMHVQACFTKEGQLAAQVAAAQTVEVVSAIVW